MANLKRNFRMVCGLKRVKVCNPSTIDFVSFNRISEKIAELQVHRSGKFIAILRVKSEN